MPATGREHGSSMEDQHLKGSLANVPPSGHSTPPFSAAVTPNFINEASVESKVVSMASSEGVMALHSPAEASPAKPGVTSPTTLDGTAETSPAISASGTVVYTVNSLVSITESAPLSTKLPASNFGSSLQTDDHPFVLTYRGVTVTLENDRVWKQFYSCGTEMILTKQGRRMFPYCRYRLAGLDPNQRYCLVLSIVPADNYKHRFNFSKWEVNGLSEQQDEGPTRAFCHHYTPCPGSDLMGGLVSFYKVKLTNNPKDLDGHIILSSMRRYIPRLHIIPLLNEATSPLKQPLVMGPESMTFTFRQTEFMAVTTYQNFLITQLKINHNPFAKGFREERMNPQLSGTETLLLNTEPQPLVFELKDQMEIKVEPLEQSPLSTESAYCEQESNPDLKPITFPATPNNKHVVRCMKGLQVLGHLVLATKRPLVEVTVKQVEQSPLSTESVYRDQESKLDLKPITFPATGDLVPAPKRPLVEVEEKQAKQSHPSIELAYLPAEQESKRLKPINFTPTTKDEHVPGKQPHTEVTPKTLSSSSSASSRRSLQGYGKRKKRPRLRFHKGWKRTPSLAEDPSPPLGVATQPEMDEVEGLTFASFATREELESHVQFLPVKNASSLPPEPSTTPIRLTESEELIPETLEERICRLEAILLKDLLVVKHRQVIHPVLQEVGLKLSSLDPFKSIDLRYLGVCLPLPPFELATKDNRRTSLGNDSEGLPFISRTGKTSDMTKIKGWKNKFIHSKQTNNGSQKNLSAFCSNMLDEYLESEAQQISERAAAFSTSPEASSVAYQLPTKGSSYVKTLDSALQQRKTVLGVNKPCPLSFKPFLHAALMAPAPTLAGDACRTDPQSSTHQSLPRSSLYAPLFDQIESKLIKMEAQAVNQGWERTRVKSRRMSTALSVMLTKKTPHDQAQQGSPPYLDHSAFRPVCGKEFCRLGCVCHSLNCPARDALHCRRLECMFNCTCSEENNEATKSSSSKLWIHDIYDTEPDLFFAPENVIAPFPKGPKACSAFLQEQIKEEDKDPVYKYLESFVTCARVRAVNSKLPPQITIEPDCHTIVVAVEKISRTENTESQQAVPKTHIEIQSACRWEKDTQMILEALCQRINHDKLSEPFTVGPYHIQPIMKIFIKKPSGAIVTYRVRIGPQASDAVGNYKEDFQSINTSSDEEQNLEDEEHWEEPARLFGVTPFLSGIMTAGVMVAMMKPAGDQKSGLLVVNGKSYNQARLLLGSMGSLHPANRLAAYVTGRLQPSADLSLKIDAGRKLDMAAKPSVKADNKLLPRVIAEKNVTDIKTHPLFHLLKAQRGKKETATLPQQALTSTTNSRALGPLNVFQRPTCSPISLTVSPSMKTPSFLSQSGTCSFRICPSSNLREGDQNQMGISLPGGFTLLRLPKPDAALTEFQTAKTDNADRVVCKTAEGPVVANETLASTEAIILSSSSEDENSDSCDDSTENDMNEDSSVDIETVEEDKQQMAISRLKEAAKESQGKIDYSSNFETWLKMQENKDARVSPSQKNKDTQDDSSCPLTKKRNNHTAQERQRRFEQRALFDGLQDILDRRAVSRLQLLSMARTEIQKLTAISNSLVEKKNEQYRIQTLHLKKLSGLSGKPVEIIQRNLKTFFQSLKIRGGLSQMEASFQRLQQSKTDLRAATTQPKPQSPPAQAMSLPPPLAPPLPLTMHQSEPPLSLPPASLPSLPPQSDAQPKNPPLPPDALKPSLTTQAAPAPPRPSATANGTPPTQPLTFPLIRSKTGRLILPSCVKPSGPGVYTLMLKKPDQDSEGDFISIQTSNIKPAKNQDTPVQYSHNVSPVSAPSEAEQPNKDVPASKQRPLQTDSSAPVPRRPRGRPPKHKLYVPPRKYKKSLVTRKGDAPPMNHLRRRPQRKQPVEDYFAPADYSGDGNKSRPLTRASLGKNFPSAKRRSWIDLEMEMELEPDSESE
ncbi:MAX gene-associated protein isoform X1 [Nerophis lumbriciformis]|uniref:MAX gene-associated protein isoform X1 n=1 Tax=Nerophis lumbriciformis TaxID=546530 RepID=UPI002AE0780C|nr:uncharacterized protein LOC133576260 isoform X1 [Nerophis lumbriciformis]